jgi:hypothetical protein
MDSCKNNLKVISSTLTLAVLWLKFNAGNPFGLGFYHGIELKLDHMIFEKQIGENTNLTLF